MDYAVVLRVLVRRFFCSDPACSRKTFAEPFAGLAVAHARRTDRQASRLSAIAKELGGRPAARVSETLQRSVSIHTLLRLLRHSPVPDAPPPRILGVDDWSIRRGRTYATILVDLQRHRIVEVLPDREAETLQAWLLAHPGVDLISRERAGTYAQGARKGAPQARTAWPTAFIYSSTFVRPSSGSLSANRKRCRRKQISNTLSSSSQKMLLILMKRLCPPLH
jgi:transposase